MAIDTMNVFAVDEVMALGQLLAKRYSVAEVEAISEEFPEALEGELFCILKMRELAAAQMLADVWDSGKKRWLGIATSAARLLGRGPDAIKFGTTQLVELGSEVPKSKHPELIKAIIADLDKGSKDERVIRASDILSGKLSALDHPAVA
jgi:hypothetical protein